MLGYSYSLDTTEVDEGMKSLIRKTPELSRRVLSKLSEAVVTRTVVHELSGQTLNRGTGTLAKSINYRLANDFLSQVGSNVAYAAIHEFGGVIKAKNAGALRFKVGDRWVMVKQVVMPKRSYLEPSLDWVFTNSAEDIMNDEVSEWLLKRWYK